MLLSSNAVAFLSRRSPPERPPRVGVGTFAQKRITIKMDPQTIKIGDARAQTNICILHIDHCMVAHKQASESKQSAASAASAARRDSCPIIAGRSPLSAWMGGDTHHLRKTTLYVVE